MSRLLAKVTIFSLPLKKEAGVEGHTPIEIRVQMDDNRGSSCYPPMPVFIESGQ